MCMWDAREKKKEESNEQREGENNRIKFRSVDSPPKRRMNVSVLQQPNTEIDACAGFCFIFSVWAKRE